MPGLPDFIIVGAMKSATTTLQEQLVRQPGIFMCEPKEPNFFSDEDQFANGMVWYKNLFANAPQDALLGEASTHYTKLPNHPYSVKRLKEHLPDAKFIYIMRHPLDRLVSHYIHEWSMGIYSCSLDEAVERYPELIAYGQYAMQLEPYFEAFGRNAILPVFFDRLISEPQNELERVCRFIGYHGEPQWVAELEPSNVSTARIRRFPMYRYLVESEVATWLRRTLLPRGLRNRIKMRLVMQRRPELNNQNKAKLESIFDRDMERLGAWLNTSICCQNFKAQTASTELNWVLTDNTMWGK